jgi:hypothetical protein
VCCDQTTMCEEQNFCSYSATCRPVPPFLHSCRALCVKRASVERANPYSIVLESDQLTQCARNRTSAHILPPAALSPPFSTLAVHSALKGHLWSVPLCRSSQLARGLSVGVQERACLYSGCVRSTHRHFRVASRSVAPPADMSPLFTLML